jgi:hypothetical protein
MNRVIVSRPLSEVEAAPKPATDSQPRARKPLSPRDALALLASLRLTVVLFVLAFVLVFCGTLAQVDAGIWTVVKTYFRSAYVWIPFQIFVPRSVQVPGGFPFPGGWLIGGLLLANLLAAHVVRFRLTWKRAGILLIHSGLVVMMLSELVTGLFAVEGIITIVEGGSSSFLELHDQNELAIIDPSDLEVDHVVVIPESLLKEDGLIRDDRLPFDVEPVRYMVNSTAPQEVDPGAPNPATAGDGKKAIVRPRPAVTGIDREQSSDVPSMYVAFKKKGGGESLGTYLVSNWWSDYLERHGEYRPQRVQVNDKTYDVYLRGKRIYKPYSVYLKKFHHTLYPGTDLDKSFSSEVRLVDPTRHEDREIEISMNEPLRYAGETFYQAGFIPGDLGTRLQVVRNPGWLMPYVSCVMVAVGMLVHFGLHLAGFLQRRYAA